MHRVWGYLLAWTAATVVAVTGSWLGVNAGIAPALKEHGPVDLVATGQHGNGRLELTLPNPVPSSPAASPTPEERIGVDAVTRRTPKITQQYWISSKGGSAQFGFAANWVQLADVKLTKGYSQTVEKRGDNITVVRFTSAEHQSSITAKWVQNQPSVEVVEEYRR